MKVFEFLNPFTKRNRRASLEERLDFARITSDFDGKRKYGAWGTATDGGGRSWNPEQTFKEFTEEELKDLPIHDLADLLVRNDASISQVVDRFMTVTSIGYSLTCEDPRGQRLLDEGQELLEKKNNGFRTFLARLFSSAMLRGNVFAEATFDEMRNFSNFFCVDPKFAYFQGRRDEVDGWVPELYQWVNGKKVVIDSENVIYMSMNPLIDDIAGHSMIQTAFPPVISDTLMMQDLRKVIANHAWVQRFIAINQVALKQAGFTWEEIKEIVKRDRAMIAKDWQDLDVDETPVGTGEIEMRQYPGASNRGFPQMDMADRAYDRKLIRGAKTTPLEMGSNEFVAESSANTQTVNHALWYSYHQDNIESVAVYLWERVLKAKGILRPVIFTLKRANHVVQREQAVVFDLIFKGIKSAVDAGIPIGTAIKLYEFISDEEMPAEVVNELEKMVSSDTARDS